MLCFVLYGTRLFVPHFPYAINRPLVRASLSVFGMSFGGDRLIQLWLISCPLVARVRVSGWSLPHTSQSLLAFISTDPIGEKAKGEGEGKAKSFGGPEPRCRRGTKPNRWSAGNIPQPPRSTFQ